MKVKGDEYMVRNVNGHAGKCWAVCNQLWNILALVYTKAEALAILEHEVPR